jgi:CheY-like chemotaxis protein
MINELPLYFHPTEIVLVDDDINYSKNLEVFLLDNNMPIQVFNDPKKALSFLKNKPLINFSDKSVQIKDEYVEKTTLDIDLSQVHQEIYNKHRFNEISVIIVDFAMPGLNGKELVEQLKQTPMKKILLTGEEGYETAVKMFNAGLIDRFFQKSDEGLFEKLSQEIAALKVQFFEQLSHSVLLALSKKSSAIPFNDPAVIKFFFETLKQNEIVEYYAVEESGSYLLMNKAGVASLLIVKSTEDMQVLYEIAEGEKNAPKEILEDLKNKKKLTYFLTEKDSSASANTWPLHDAKPLKGDNQPYYYALIKNANAFKPKSKIYNYQQFLEENYN